MLLTTDHELIRDTARGFAREVLAPGAAARDREARFPADELRQMAALGFLGMPLPEAFGGAALDHVSIALVLEEIAAADGACSTILSVHNSVACLPIYRYGNEAQKQRWLPGMARGELLGAFALTEPQAGSDAAALRMRAVRDGNGYRLSGTKQFITSGAKADVMLTFAVTDPQAGRKGISAFIVPTTTPGYEVVRVEDKMGQRSSDTAQIRFDELRLDGEHLLGEEGAGYRIALSNLEGGRIGIAAQSIGMARAALDAANAYAHERESFGKPIFEHQAVAFRLADMATQVEAARTLCLHAAALRDADRPCLKEASMAKLFASEMAERVCSSAMQVFGGYGYLGDYEIERICRDVRVTQIYEGTSDVQRLVISRAL